MSSEAQTVKIPQHNTPQGTWCRFSGCDSKSGICRMCEPDPACWADPLTRAERAELARMLARNCQRFGEATRCTAKAIRRKSSRPPAAAVGAVEMLRCAGNEMADLRLDVTERAAVADR